MTLRIVFIAAAALLASGIAFAQEADQSALRTLNHSVLRHYEQARGAPAGQLPDLRKQAIADIRQREAALSSLIATDPDAALGMAFSDDLAAELRASFPESARHFERRRTWTGTVESAVEDNPESAGSHTVHRLKTDRRTLLLYSGNAGQIAYSGPITVTGLEVNGKVAVTSFNSSLTVAAAATTAINGVTGQQSVLTILINLPAYTLPSGVEAEYIKGVLYGNAWSTKQNTPNFSVDDFWQQNSDGATSAPFSAGKVAGPYLLSSNFNTDATGASFCDYISMKNAAIAAADADVNFLLYNRVVIVMPNNGACTWSGVSGIGYWSATSLDGTFSASFTWLRADQLSTRTAGVQLATHELGHGMGLNHAKTREYPGPPRQPLGAIGAAGTLNEYGDAFSAMGTGLGFYSAQHAQEVLGWLAPLNYTQVSTTGTYAVTAWETRPATGVVKALRVLRDAASNSWLWIEYRTNSGIYDATLNSQVWSGALIHYEDASTGAYTGVLDFTSATSSFLDPALAVGQTWSDPYSSLSITATSIAGGVLNLSIGFGAAACTPANPTVTLSPVNPTVNPGGTTSFTVAVTNKNSSGCPVSTYSLTAAQPAGFSGTFSATALTLAGGAAGSATLTEIAGAATGTFALSVTASDTATGSTAFGKGSANITVAAVCSAAIPGVTITPGTTSMVPGGSTAFTVTVKNNNSAACASTSFNLTSAQPAGFTGTFLKTSVSSLASGASASTTLTEKAGTVAGFFTLTVTGTDAARPTSLGTGTAGITVAACTLAAPVISLTPSSISILAGGSAVYTVNVTSTNSAGCAAATYALAATQPVGLTGSLSVPSLTLASGAAGTASLTEKSGTKTGTYSVTVTATSGALKGTAVATTVVK